MMLNINFYKINQKSHKNQTNVFLRNDGKLQRKYSKSTKIGTLFQIPVLFSVRAKKRQNKQNFVFTIFITNDMNHSNTNICVNF